MHATCTHVNRENAVYVLIVHIVRVLHVCMVLTLSLPDVHVVRTFPKILPG